MLKLTSLLRAAMVTVLAVGSVALASASPALAAPISSAGISVDTTVDGETAVITLDGLEPVRDDDTLALTVLHEDADPLAPVGPDLLYSNALYLHGRTSLSVTVQLQGQKASDYILAVGTNTGATLYSGPLVAKEIVVTVPDAPAAPTVTHDGSVVVNWSAPATGGSPITSYSVIVEHDGNARAYSVGGESKAIDLGTLASGTYAVSIIAVNVVGSSQPSPITEFTVIDEVVSPEPSVTPEPSETPEPSSSPEPSASPEPTVTPDPSVSPEPTVSPEPSAMPDPSASPDPSISPDPSATPGPTTTSDPTASPAPTPGDDSIPAPTTGDLTDENRGPVAVPEAAYPGQTIQVILGAESAGRDVVIRLGSVVVAAIVLDSEGATRVTIPSDTDLGAYKIAVHGSDGSLIGWDGIEIVEKTQVGPGGELLATTGTGPEIVIAISLATVLLGVGAFFLYRRVSQSRHAIES